MPRMLSYYGEGIRGLNDKLMIGIGTGLMHVKAGIIRTFDDLYAPLALVQE
jgi:hypothetical protein